MRSTREHLKDAAQVDGGICREIRVSLKTSKSVMEVLK